MARHNSRPSGTWCGGSTTHSKRDKEKRKRIMQGRGERCTLLRHERCTQHSDEPPSMGDLRRASGGYFELPSYHLHCIVPIPLWGLNWGPSVHKTDALPQSYRCLLWKSALWTSALQTQTLQPSLRVCHPQDECIHGLYLPAWHDTIHDHRVYSVVSPPLSKQDKDKEGEEKARGQTERGGRARPLAAQ